MLELGESRIKEKLANWISQVELAAVVITSLTKSWEFKTPVIATAPRWTETVPEM
jgi:hypothetical protein